jgi:hypothetical protein
MDVSQLPVLAGSVATTIFVGSYLPMLVRALRTRELSSYSRPSLVLANAGNVVQTGYVVTLPIGPIWGLHAFYLVATLMMLVLHLRYASQAGRGAGTRRAGPVPRPGVPARVVQQPSPGDTESWGRAVASAPARRDPEARLRLVMRLDRRST